MSLLRSHICKFIIGIIVIFAISPIPALFITHNYSYQNGFISIFQNFAQLSSISIPKVDWMHESIFFSANQMIHTSNHSTPLFPYIWEIYFISIVRFTFTLAIGFFISLGIGHLFFKVPNSFKKFTTVLKWIPYSFLHCSITMFSLITTSIHRTIYKPSLLLIIYHRMQYFHDYRYASSKKWIPFLKNTNEYEIKHDSFLVDTLFLALTSNHKSILGSIILSFVFMECVFHANGLLQFIVQFGGNSPIIVTIGLLLLYIPYSILSFLQTLWTTNYSKQQSYTLTRSVPKP